MRILERIHDRGEFELDYEVLLGISSVQALAGRRKVALNNVGKSIAITNGRDLAEGFPNSIDSMVVMLNAGKVLPEADGDLDMYRGTYVGLPDEILVAGKLKEVIDDIERVREASRREKGRIMDSVLLKKPIQNLK